MTREQGDLRTYLKVLWRWRLLVLAVLVVIPTTVYLVVSSQPKVYESSVLLQVQPSAVDTSLFSNQVPAPQAQTLLSAARLVTTTYVAEAAAKELGEPRSRGRSLLDNVKATPDVDADFISIAARSHSSTRAADVANAFAAAVVSFRKNQAVGRLNATIGKLVEQLNQIGGRTTAARDARKQLSEQLQRLRALRAAQGNNATIVEPAVASSVPVAPRVTRTVLLSGIVALLLAFGAVVLAQGADRKIRDPMELEELTDRPLLSTVPRSAFGDVDHGGVAGAEAFQTLRGSLTYFNIDRPIDSVLISSPLPGDGKTTVATNLAIAMARAGKDVILVDGDLRRPRVASRFHVTPKPAGLGGVLVGEVGLEEALIEYELDTPGGWLRLLPADPPPPNPSELLASERMERLLDQLTRMSDLVIIDSTPLLTVSDSLPLIEIVSGVVAVARLNETSKDAIRRFERVVGTAGGTLLGSVLTGASAAGLYGGYGYLVETSTNGGPPRGPQIPSPRLRWPRLRLGRSSVPPADGHHEDVPSPESVTPPSRKQRRAEERASAGRGRA